MPTTFTELLKPSKSAGTRVMRWEPVKDSLWRVGVLTLEDRRESQQYEVDETATDIGRAFTLRKPAGGFYCVDIKGWGADSCTCKGFEYGQGKPCRHLEAIRVLIKEGKL